MPIRRSIVHATVMYLAPADLPKNEGSMRPVLVIAPEGSELSTPWPPAPVTMSTNHVAEEIAEAIFQSLAGAVPHAVNAGFGRRLRYAITGTDPRTTKALSVALFPWSDREAGHRSSTMVGPTSVS